MMVDFLTLIMGASNTISGLLKNPLWVWMQYFTALLFAGAVIYMIIAGTSSFQLLMDKNIVYYTTTDTDVKDYYINKEKNIKLNLIRNNLINTSFRCIRNALICLFVVFTLTLINQLKFSARISGSNTTQFPNTKIYYSNSVIQNINFEKFRLTAEDLIHNYNDLDKLLIGESTGLIDTKNQIFIKVVKYSDESVCVMSIESYIQ